MVNIGDYHSAVSFIVSEIKKFPKHLVPKIVIRSGNLKSPGISDLDLLGKFYNSYAIFINTIPFMVTIFYP